MLFLAFWDQGSVAGVAGKAASLTALKSWYIWLFMTHQDSADLQGHFEAHIISLHCK